MEGMSRANNSEHEKTPRNLRWGVEAQIQMNLGDIETKGREHLAELGPEERVVIATSHVSDLDMPLIIRELGEDLNIAVVDQSTNHSPSGNLPGYIANKIAGNSNFISVDYENTVSGRKPHFNPDNFIPMVQALENGKAMIIAAHNPTYSGALGEGSVGAVYLAQLARAAILPVSANLKTSEVLGIDGKNQLETMRKKPDAEVLIGAPIHLEPIEGVDVLKGIFDKREAGEKLTPEEVGQFKKIVKELRDQSDIVMKQIAEMLPEEKRGPYQESQTEIAA